MSENKKRFNLIDLLIIVVIIGVVFVAWQYLSAGNKVAEGTVTYKINILKTEQNVADEIQVGDKIFDSVKNFEIGEVKEIVVTDATESVYDEVNNVFKTVTVPERIDILITVEGNGKTDESGTVVNGYELTVGKKMYIKGSNFATEAIAWEIGGGK
ncbi:MAG: DUF4330 domain-containing protein [Clostridia bacterium]|nr:DUF4330 domain-containing protein [Clostridia bacterium]